MRGETGVTSAVTFFGRWCESLEKISERAPRREYSTGMVECRKVKQRSNLCSISQGIQKLWRNNIRIEYPTLTFHLWISSGLIASW